MGFRVGDLKQSPEISLCYLFVILEWSPDFSPETSSKKKKAASSKHPAATVNGFREGPNSPPLTENIHEDDLHRSMNTGHTNGSSHKGMPADNFPPKYGSHSASPVQHAANGSPYEKTMQMVSSSQSRVTFIYCTGLSLNSRDKGGNFDPFRYEWIGSGYVHFYFIGSNR